MIKKKEKTAKDWCVDCDSRCLDSIAFLKGLPVEKQNRIMEGAVGKVYEKGVCLFDEGDPVDGIYIIHSGRVKLSSYNNDGKEAIIDIIASGDTIWDDVFINNSKFHFSGICLAKSEVCKISRKDLEDVMKEPDVAMNIIGMLSQKLNEAAKKSIILSKSDPKKRVASFILYRYNKSEENSIVLKLDDIAASINLRAETVSRKISELEKEGFIRKIGQSRIEIADLTSLKCLAESEH